MADVTMCKGINCDDRKNSCYRYLATANEYRQAYFIESPIKDGKCDEYWDVVPYRKPD